MTPDDAEELLGFHSGRDSRIDDLRSRVGFLGMLRPFSGQLNERSFHEVMACIFVLRGGLSTHDSVKRRTLADLFAICSLARRWATDPDGMLPRNRLISDEQADTLLDWVRTVEWAVMTLLDTGDVEEAFAGYEHSPEFAHLWKG